MRNRRTEQGKDAVAQGLRHIPVIAMHDIHHQLQGRVDNRTGVFGVEPLDEGGRTFEVRKQGGDGFRLAICCATGFHRLLFGADTLGQMGGGVG